jgi:hypothetical protein
MFEVWFVGLEALGLCTLVIAQDCSWIIMGWVFSRRDFPFRLLTWDRSMQPGLTDTR